MSVKVNLLPGEVAERERAGQARALAALGVLVVIAALGVVYWLQRQEVAETAAQLDAENAATAELQAELATLAEFAELDRMLGDADMRVTAVMGGELGMAGMLQDVAAVMPPDTELSDLSVTRLAVVASPVEVEPPLEVAVLTTVGRTNGRHAPGLERLLIELDKVASFRDVFFGSAAVDNDGAVAFDLQVDVGPEALTGRYADGLPETLR